MKKFNFRLQKILDLREKLEEAQRLKLSAAVNAHRAILHRQEILFEKAAETRTAAVDMDINALRHADLLFKKAVETKVALQPELEKARKIMEKEQAEYTKRHRETQALAVLRKKHLDEYRREELREETAEIDEMSKRPRT